MARGDVIAEGYVSFDDSSFEDVIIFEEGASDEIITEPSDIILTPEQELFYYGTRSPFDRTRVLPSTGAISMSQIKTEVEASGQVSLNDADFRALIERDAGKQQHMSEYRGKSAELPPFSEDNNAEGSWNSCGSGTGYSTHYADSSRYHNVSTTSPDGGTITAYTWIMIPWGASKPANGQLVKLDYVIQAGWSNSSDGTGLWEIGATALSPGRFENTAQGANAQYTFSSTETLINGSSTGHSWHQDGGTQLSGSKFSSKVFNHSTYFNWGAPLSYLSFRVRATVRGTNRNNTVSTSSINYKITEM